MAAAIMMAHAATVAAACARVVTDAVTVGVDIIAALAAIAISTVAGVIIAHAVAISIDKIATAACAMVIADAIAIGVYIIVAHTVTVCIHVVAIAKAAALIVADTVTIGIHIANTCAVASTIACLRP